MIKRSSEKRRTTSAAAVRGDARDENKKGGGFKFCNLPEGIRIWEPDRKGYVDINFVPYKVRADNHPDRIGKGMPWHKIEFRVHRLPDGTRFVCPRDHDGRKCDFCEKFFELWRAKAKAEEKKPYQAQPWTAFNIVDPDDEEKVAVYASASSKFWGADAGLKAKLDVLPESMLLFFETNKKGRTVRARFVEKEFNGNKFFECAEVKLKKREPLGDEWIEKAVQLDKGFLILPSEEQMKKYWKQAHAAPAGRRDREERPKKKKKKLKGDAAEGKTGKKKKKGKYKCPIKGGVFGKDCDKFKKCATCPIYSKCEAASG